MENLESLTNEEINKLESAKSAAEWNQVCNEVKRARGGEYPLDWFKRVIQSGLMASASSQWEKWP